MSPRISISKTAINDLIGAQANKNISPLLGPKTLQVVTQSSDAEIIENQFFKAPKAEKELDWFGQHLKFMKEFNKEGRKLKR